MNMYFQSNVLECGNIIIKAKIYACNFVTLKFVKNILNIIIIV